MLSNIHVKNFALIDEADIELDNNLNILSGETGAGKSILLGAVNLALGARTSKDSVKSDSDYALAELTFTNIGEAAKSVALELGITETDEVVISRKLYSNGKSLIRINGETFSASQARLLTAELIDVYGQNEHQSLTDPEKHLCLLDSFAQKESAPLLERLSEEYREYCAVKKEIAQFDLDTGKLNREIDRISFEIKEIEEAALKEGEEEKLKAEHVRLANARLISEAVGHTTSSLYENDGVSDLLSGALKQLSRVTDFDPRLEEFYNTLSEIDDSVSELYRDMADYLEENDGDDERLLEVEERLDLISHLHSKYGNTIAGINKYLAEDREALEKLLDHDTYLNRTKEKLKNSEKRLTKLSNELHEVRVRYGKELEQSITEALQSLNFNYVCFEIAFEEKEGFYKDGRDSVRFMVNLNPGEDLKPLDKVASGGELSRIMLAIKSVMAERDGLGTLIFDEIDTGISGRTAQKVAEKLVRIANSHQVICITHLPQLASMADTHFYIEKSVTDKKTKVSITKLDEKGVVKELARMLSGAEVTEGILESASEMSSLAKKTKQQIRK